MPDTSPSGARRPNRNMMWLIGLLVAVVVVVGLMFQSRGGDGRSGAQVYESASQNTPTGAAAGGSGG